MSFMLALPKISLHGAGAIGDMVKLVAGKQWGKALIVTDGQLVKLGLLDSLFAALDEQQMAYQLFDEVFPNPTEALVQQGYAAYQAARCDYLIAFGGGSPIDTAKAIKILTANPGPSTAYSGVGKVKNAGVPLVAINTTAGTAAEMTSNAVIIDSERQVKEVIIDPNLIPDIAVDDASVMLDIPPAVTAATGMDALTHAVEAYIGRSTTASTRADALEAVRLIFENLENAYEHGNNIQAREHMLTAAFLAGRSFSKSYVGYVHAIAHSLGGQYGVAHGLANAVILPYFLEEYGDACVPQLAKLARCVGMVPKHTSDRRAAASFILWVKEMNRYMQIPEAIKEIRREDIPALSKHAAAEGNPLYPVPVLMDAKELAGMYEKIMEKGER